MQSLSAQGSERLKTASAIALRYLTAVAGLRLRQASVAALGLVFAADTLKAESLYDIRLEQAVMAIVAESIGEIRQGLAYDYMPGVASAYPPMPPKPMPAPKNWWIVTTDRVMRVSQIGSIQTYSDGSVPTAEQRRAMARRAVTRILTF